MRAAGVSMAFALLAFLLGAPVAVGADDGLVPSRRDVPGYRITGKGTRVARSALGGHLPRAVLRARTQGVAFRGGSRRLTAGVFSFAGAKQASQALRGLRTGRRRTGKGFSGLTRNRSTRKASDVAVVFRVGSALGAVRWQTPHRLSRAPAVAVAFAGQLAARLRRVRALTAWQRTLDGIHPNGAITPRLALQAFTVAYGPLPGVRRPAGPGGAPRSATLAMQLVAREWSHLSAAQHTAIDRDLGAPHDGGSARVARAASQTLTPDPHYQALADKYKAIYRAKLPGTPAVTIKAYKASENITDGKGAKAFADALPVNASGEWGVGAPAYCRVRVPPTGQAASAQFQELVMAHETFHCFQFALMANWRERTAWIIEGMADWAAVTVDPVPVSVGAGNFKAYLQTPATPLFARSYDAVGFWGHADEVGGNGSLWNRIPGILGAPSDPVSYSLAGGTGSPFVDTWASSVWRFPGAGDAWTQTDPYLVPLASFPGLSPSLIEDSTLVTSAPYTLAEYVAAPDPDRPLLRVDNSEGTLRTGTNVHDYGVASSEWFCIGTCKCPPGEQDKIPHHQDVKKFLALALTGGASRGAGDVSYHSLDEFCEPTGVTGLQIRSEGLSVKATFKTGTCSVTKGVFEATAHDRAWSIEIRIRGFDGYKKVYPVQHASNPYFRIDGPGGPYSNAYAAPNHGPEFGQIQFYPDGKKMSFGFEYAWNRSGQDAVLPLGVMTCKKPKR